MAAPHPPPAWPGGEPPPRTQYALLYAACPQSAARPLPQYPQQASSPAPAHKGTPRAAPGRRQADVSQCSVGGGEMTRRPALVPAWRGRRDRPRQSDPLAPHPTRFPGRAPDEGRCTDQTPPPPRQTDPPVASQTAPRAQDCQTAPAEHAARRDARRHGGLGPGATGQAPRGGWRGTTAPAPPPSPPTHPPPARGMPETGHGGASPLPPPKARGSPPPPPERAAAPGGGRPLSYYATRPQAALPAPTETTTSRQTRARTQGRHADHTRGQQANTNQSSMEAKPSMN